MGRYTGKDHNEAHNDGEADGAKNTYNPPVPISPLDEFAWSEDTLKDWRDLNDSYDRGWNNGYKTR